MLPSQIKSKISAAIERLTGGDLESPESRERFLANLPPWLFGTVGGNSPCVAVEFDSKHEILVFDAGSGIRELGMAATQKKHKLSRYHIFFSHFHWDHIMGLPFFGPAYDPSNKIDYYSPEPSFETFLRNQMTPPYFPVYMDSMAAKSKFHVLDGPMKLLGASISYRKMNHPGNSYSFRVEYDNHKFIYATDTELSAEDFTKNEENCSFFEGTDLLIIDSQYTLGEAIEKYNWGHSAFSLAVDFAANWNMKHMVLFHHDPTYDDHKLYNILQSAKWYTERMNIKGIKLSLATEGMEITL
jgi:phosphoribosyl 1,2-cyclic phosphodiesterase